MPRPLRVAWARDESLWRRLNAEERNYWHAYTEEILERMGLTADALEPEALAKPEVLARYSVVILGSAPAGGWPESAAHGFAEWVRQGGTRGGFATDGLDDVFGIEPREIVWQEPEVYSIAGYFHLLPGPLTAGIHPEEHADQPLIVISDIRPVTPVASKAVAEYLRAAPEHGGSGAHAKPTGHALATERALGQGWAFYLGFDVGQTMWLLHQGRPVDADHDGDGYLRSMDARLIAENHPEVAYADEIHVLLRCMVGRQPMPFIHEIPPLDGRPADVLLYFGGDDEGEPLHQVASSDFMASRGLPYHINLMPVEGRFAVDAAEIEHIEANGHELSLHYDFISGFAHPTGFAADDVHSQAAVFRATFGRPAVCSVTHWCRWTGGCEPARWMMDEGQLADGSWLGPAGSRLNPTNVIDLSFGSFFPRRLWDDWRCGNERLRFVQEPVTAYEVGYDGDRTDFAILHRAIAMARRDRATLCLFYHPVYLATYPACREAIDELLRVLAEERIVARAMGNDELARWWLARGDARIANASANDECVTFEARCDYPDGFVAKLCLGEATGCRCVVGDAEVEALVSDEPGGRWAFLTLPPGTSRVRNALT